MRFVPVVLLLAGCMARTGLPVEAEDAGPQWGLFDAGEDPHGGPDFVPEPPGPGPKPRPEPEPDDRPEPEPDTKPDDPPPLVCPSPDGGSLTYGWTGFSDEGDFVFDGNARVSALYDDSTGLLNIELTLFGDVRTVVQPFVLSPDLAHGLFEGAEYHASFYVSQPWWTEWTLTLQDWDSARLRLFLSSGPSYTSFGAPGLDSFLKLSDGRACSQEDFGCGPQESFSLIAYAHDGKEFELFPQTRTAMRLNGEPYLGYLAHASRFLELQCTDTPDDWVELAIAPAPLEH